jgi:hypothetical protein
MATARRGQINCSCGDQVHREGAALKAEKREPTKQGTLLPQELRFRYRSPEYRPRPASAGPTRLGLLSRHPHRTAFGALAGKAELVVGAKWRRL